MFFKNSNNDNFDDLRRKEEYERQKQANLARGLGNFLYLYIAYGFVFLFSTAFTATVLELIFGVGTVMSFVIGLIAGIGIFKVPYVRENPVKSFIIICFVFGLFMIAFPQSS